MCVCISVGYANVSDRLFVNGSAYVSRYDLPDLYITEITPKESAGITVNDTSGTVMFASVTGAGKATFTVNLINVSETVYLFDRVIDGSETNFEGAYSGTEITYELSGISHLDEIMPNSGTLSFDITITVPEGITADYYILDFHFVDKYGIPGSEYFPDDIPDGEVTLIQRLSDVLNNKYKTSEVAASRRYLIDEVIQVISWDGTPYVGSMDQSVLRDKIDHLFGDIITDEHVSFILKNEDLNKDGYSEIAMYSTSDPLDCTDQWAGNGVVCVYVTVFTPALDEQGRIAGYNMVCEAVKGYCSEVRYSEFELIPSFSTDTWLDDVGYWTWTEELGSYVDKVPDDAWSNDWTKPFREDFNSYNLYYMYDFWRTAPYGRTIDECLEGKILDLRLAQ